ncbi:MULTISPECIES: AAA family ATPase [unclassified Microbacterium]|uniref:ATP-binding protein n=1 Tax=unclassified Microbacterium TaxID=2609290 RepID=UPI0012FB23E7|nr:AAA family ATPase [Microbacterium sp. MAH-37]MVQ42271.1 AAA family ATPase [Microbacterium sp. MAH-37]
MARTSDPSDAASVRDTLDPPQLRLHLLGGFRATRDSGAPIPERWPRPSARTLVKLLAIAPAHRMHRDEIMAACWPDADPPAAARSLGVALHAARRALQPELVSRQPSNYLVGDGAMLQLDPATVWIDADHAERLASLALASGDAAQLRSAHTALDGELLPEDRYAPWTAERRDHLARLRLRVALELCEALLSADPEEAITTARGVLAQHPAEERAHRSVMRASLALGLRRQAIQQYHACREALDVELGVRPSPQTEQLHLEILDVNAGAAGPVDAAILPPPVLRTALATPLRGRREVLDRLAVDDTAKVLLVTGEAGLGKTSIVAEHARRAFDAGAIVLWGAGHDTEGQTPYGAFVEALDGWLSGRPATERARAGSEYPELAGILPSLGNTLPELQRSPDDERRRLFQSVTAVFEELAAAAPVLLVLDDLHAADLGTVQLLSSLARRQSMTGASWRVIVTLREDEIDTDDPRRALLDALARDRLAETLALPRLTRAECLALAADVTGADAPERVWELSLGHPLFAIELAREVEHTSEGPRSYGIRQLVTARLSRLPAAARRIAEVVATAGGEAAVAEVVDVATQVLHPPLSAGETAEAVDEALRSSVLYERDVVIDGRPVPGLVFQHPLVRLTAYDELSAVRRQVLHSAYADVVLRRRPHAVDALATHLVRADDPRATTYLRQAADRAASLSANDTADLYYAELISRLDAISAEAAWVRLDRSVVLQRTGRFDEARAVLDEALGELRRRGDHDGVVLAGARIAEVLVSTAAPQDALVVLDRDPVTGATGPLAAATHHLSRTRALLVTGDYADAVEYARRAESVAAQTPESSRRGLFARALQYQAVSLALAGRVSEAGPAAEQALPHAEAYGDPQILSSVLSVQREQARRSGRLREALAIGHHALELAMRSGEQLSQAFEQANLAELHLLVEEVDLAAELAEAAVAAAPPAPAGWSTPYAFVALALVQIRRGEDPSGALDIGQAAAEASADRQALDEIARAKALLLLEQEKPDAALHVLRGLTSGSAALEAWARLQLGDAAAAERIAAEEISRATGEGELITAIDARIILATARALRGDTRRAAREFEELTELAEELPYPAGLSRIARARAAATEA